MKKIALILPYGGVGGIERLVMYLYNHYKQLNYSVKVIKIIKLETDLIYFGQDEFYLSDLDFIEMSKIERLFFYIKAPFLIRKILKQEAITHSIAFADMANLFSSLTFTNEYKIASIHSLKSVEFLNHSYINFLYKLAYRTSYKWFNKVVCISNTIHDDLIQNCNFKFHERLKVIYNPHNIGLIREKANEPIEYFEESYFEAKTILFLGRISIEKAPWHLIKAFSILNQQVNDVSLIFVGDGDLTVQSYCEHLVHHYQLEGKVLFLGRKDNPYKYIKRSNVVALTSYYEGTPNVIVEAIALGVPIVSSNCTDGIFELMTLNSDIKAASTPLIETESGIVTPSFFKGKFEIPVNEEYIDEEFQFAAALYSVLTNDNITHRLLMEQSKLLEKFDIDKVAAHYFKE